MHTDSTDKYRSILDRDPPEFVDRVDTPWDNLPDFAEYNDSAYRRIQRDLTRLRRTTSGRTPHSKGILILGEAGTGKTHILMRAARNLTTANHVCFVRRPNDEDAVAQHIWANMVSSLARQLSGRAKSQLDDLLAHVFSSVLIAEFEQDIKDGKDALKKQRWTDMLRSDPFNLFSMLGEGENRNNIMRQIRSRTLRYLQHNHPEVDQRIARALITYCFVSSETRRRVVLTWLSGQDIDETESQMMGLPQMWVNMDDESNNISIQQRREEQAFRAIQTIGILSTYYQPLILAFDQLEGLQGEQRLTQRWGDVVREIFTMAPNYLIVTCIFPSLWESWFQTELDESAAQRISQQTVTLDTFGPQHGVRFLKKQLEESFTSHCLPTSIYPFTEEDVVRLCVNIKSPRLFIQEAKTAFESWLDDCEPSFDVATSSSESRIAMQQEIDLVLQQALAKFEDEHRRTYAREIQTEQDFFGRIKCVIQTLLSNEPVTWSKATYGHYVMPPGIVLCSHKYGDSLCIAVINSAGRAFTSRMSNMAYALRDGDDFKNAIAIRDARCSVVTPKGQKYIQKFKRKRGRYLTASIDECAMLNALYDTIVTIEEHNLSIGNHEINKDNFRAFIKNKGIMDRSQLLKTASKYSLCFEHTLEQESSLTEVCISADDILSESIALEDVLDPLEVDGECEIMAVETGSAFAGSVTLGKREADEGTEQFDGLETAVALAHSEVLQESASTIGFPRGGCKGKGTDRQEVHHCQSEYDYTEQSLEPSHISTEDSYSDTIESGNKLHDLLKPSGLEVTPADTADVVIPEVPSKDSISRRSTPSGRSSSPMVRCLIGDTELDSLHVGVLGELKDGQGRLGISLTKPQCIVILGYMGSGKSYALGVLIENALLSSPPLVRCVRPMSVVAFNYRKNPGARFEYTGYAQPNTNEGEAQELITRYSAEPSAISNVNVFGYGPELRRRQEEYSGVSTFPIQFRSDELGAEHWEILMKPPSPQTEYMDVIRDIIKNLYYQDRLTFRNLEKYILDDERFSESQRNKAKNRLGFARNWIADDRSYEWGDVLNEGSLNVFDLRMQTMTSDEALRLCLVITDLVRRTHNGVNKMVVFDEAHEYVDSKELVDELENAITQIRHDGLTFVLASQFPERIPERLFKYLSTRLLFKLPTTKAISYLQRMAPNLGSLSANQVANLGLEQGMCFIQTDDDCTDSLLSTPQLLKVRPRCSLHGGATIRHS